jgi:sigma-E factor negative regulatory protein RseC
MIEQQGRIVAIANGRAKVLLGGMSGCPSCDAGKGCGAGVFGRLLRRNPVVLELENEINARDGQAVMVGISEGIYLRLITRLYLFPLLAALAGAAIAFYFCVRVELGQAGSDVVTLLGGLACGTAAILWNRKVTMEFPGPFIVHLLRVI